MNQYSFFLIGISYKYGVGFSCGETLNLTNDTCRLMWAEVPDELADSSQIKINSPHEDWQLYNRRVEESTEESFCLNDDEFIQMNEDYRPSQHLVPTINCAGVDDCKSLDFHYDLEIIEYTNVNLFENLGEYNKLDKEVKINRSTTKIDSRHIQAKEEVKKESHLYALGYKVEIIDYIEVN